MKIESFHVVNTINSALAGNHELEIHQEFMHEGHGVSIWVNDQETADKLLALAVHSDRLANWLESPESKPFNTDDLRMIAEVSGWKTVEQAADRIDALTQRAEAAEAEVVRLTEKASIAEAESSDYFGRAVVAEMELNWLWRQVQTANNVFDTHPQMAKNILQLAMDSAVESEGGAVVETDNERLRKALQAILGTDEDDYAEDYAKMKDIAEKALAGGTTDETSD